MTRARTVSVATRLNAVMISLLLTAAVHGADCYNDEVPSRSDLEPPIPGSNTDLLRVSDDDVKRMLEAARAYERNYASDRSAGDSTVPRTSTSAQ